MDINGDSVPEPFLQRYTDVARQWRLNAWPNIVITVVLLGITLWLACVGVLADRDDFCQAGRELVTA